MIRSAQEYRASPRKITIYNTLDGQKRSFDPIDPAATEPRVLMYVCGLTPQDHSHIGHGLSAMRFDLVRRYLEYRRLNVQFIQNVTDIDDKIIDRAARTGEDPLVFTRRFSDEYYECLGRLHVAPVTTLTRVTEFVPQIISFIQGLIEKEFAYVTPEGNVYFDVQKKGDYGKLSNQNTSMLLESVRKELDKQKQSPLDFALWKRDDTSPLSSPSLWGVGRPGWHIECSVMIYETLGPQIDIHGGGLDLKFPHHENEIAQSEAYTGVQMARVWMHSGLLNIDGQKMSKSLNNFIKLTDGIDQFGPDILRFVITRQHYRSAIDLNDKLFKDNLNSILEFHRLFDRAGLDGDNNGVSSVHEATQALQADFEQAMDNDFNTSEALVALEQERNKILQLIEKQGELASDQRSQVRAIRDLGRVLGLFFVDLACVEEQGLKLVSQFLQVSPLSPAEITQMITERNEARAKKNFSRSDELRDEFVRRGIEILDGRSGTSWRFASR